MAPIIIWLIELYNMFVQQIVFRPQNIFIQNSLIQATLVAEVTAQKYIACIKTATSE